MVIFKKITILLLCIFLFAGTYTGKFDYWFGKQVKIEICHRIYSGQIISIAEIQLCNKRDALNFCIEKDYFYSMVLLQKDRTMITIIVEKDTKIEETK